MAKKEVNKYPYPSRFGSSKSMIISEPENSMVVCEDEYGRYNTQLYHIDSGLTDPNRCSSNRLNKLFQGKKEKDKK